MRTAWATSRSPGGDRLTPPGGIANELRSVASADDRSQREIAGCQASQRDNLQLEDTLRRELEQGRLSTSSMNWVIHNASQAVVEHKESVRGAMLSTGVNAALDVVEFGANISLLAKIAIKGARRFVGRLAGPYFDELVNRMCA